MCSYAASPRLGQWLEVACGAFIDDKNCLAWIAVTTIYNYNWLL